MSVSKEPPRFEAQTDGDPVKYDLFGVVHIYLPYLLWSVGSYLETGHHRGVKVSLCCTGKVI